MTTGNRRIRVDLPDSKAIVAEDEADHRPPWWRRNLGRLVVAGLLVLAGLLYANSRVNPPPSPPDAATQQQLSNLRADLDAYLSGRGGLRDAQYAKTVYTLCALARDVGDTTVLNDPDYRCAQLLAAPPPNTATSPAPSVTRNPSSSSPAAPTSATPTTRSSPTSSRTAAAPASSSSAAPAPTTSTSTALIPGVLCALPTLPALPLCPGGTT